MKKKFKELKDEEIFEQDNVEYVKVGAQYAMITQSRICTKFDESTLVDVKLSLKEVMDDFEIAVRCNNNKIVCNCCPVIEKCERADFELENIYGRLKSVLIELKML